MTFLDALEKILGGIVDTGDDLGISFGIGSPNNDDFIEMVTFLEITHVLPDLLDVIPFIVTGDQIIRAVRLIGSNEMRIVNRGQGLVLFEIRRDLALDIPFENLGAFHCSSDIERTDIPSSENEIIGMDHGKDLIQRNIDVISFLIDAEFHGTRLSDAAVIVGLNETVFGVEGNVVLVCGDGSSQGTSIVSTPTNEHKTALDMP